MVRCPPPLVLNFTQAHLCDTIPHFAPHRRLVFSFTQAPHLCDTMPHLAPYRAISVRYPIKNTHTQKSFAILSLQASRDIKSIAAGPLRTQLCYSAASLNWICGAPSRPYFLLRCWWLHLQDSSCTRTSLQWGDLRTLDGRTLANHLLRASRLRVPELNPF